MIPEAVLFDLDDTLVDHSLAARTAIDRIRRESDAFSNVDLEHLLHLWNKDISAYWPRVIKGELSLFQNRVKRLSNMAKELGQNLNDDDVSMIAEIYSREYADSCAVIEGVLEILEKIRYNGTKIGIITNNIAEMKYEKVDRLGLTPYVDSVILSGDYRIMKPDPEIFHIAIEKLGPSPAMTVMVGDSLENDVSGAVKAGMKAVWFNRGEAKTYEFPEIRSIASYLPADKAWDIIKSALDC